MERRKFLKVAAAAGSVAIAGCSGDGGSSGPEPDKTVVIEGNNFDPLKAELDPGQVLEWSNERGEGSGQSHTVKSTQFTEDATEWDFDQSVEANNSITHTFEESGVYEYLCSTHSKYVGCGVVVVGDVSYDTVNLPCG
jgi:plastocyanin